MVTVSPKVFDGNNPATRIYEVRPDLSFAGGVELGHAFTLKTLDASGNQIREGMQAESISQDALFPVTGPIEIKDVRAGDTVGLSILSLQTAPEAHSWTRPGIGIGPDFGYHVRRINIEGARWPGQPDIGLNIQPHVGTLGVLPSIAREARDLGDYGGNVDMSELGAGATLWVRAQVDGAGVFAGDVHAGIADAEICGTGLETPGEIELSVEVRHDWSPALPVIARGSRAWMISVDSTVERALVKAADAVVPLLSRYLDVPLAEAYLILGQLLEVRVCQIVNPHVSISVSLGQGLDACFGAPGMLTTEPTSSRKAD